MDRIWTDTDNFIREYDPGLSEYCCIVIDKNGHIHECSENHLKTLISMSKDSDILSKIPEGKSPLFYLTDRLQCITVDYENQLFAGNVTKEQTDTLEKLRSAGMMIKNMIDIKKEC